GCRQPLEIDPKADAASGFHLAADINLRGGILADEDDRQTRRTTRPPGERGNPRRHFPANALGDRDAVEQAGRHWRGTIIGWPPLRPRAAGVNRAGRGRPAYPPPSSSHRAAD